MMQVGNANWRLMAQSILKPVNVQTPGVEAWIVSKEGAARLVDELRRRQDFRELRNGGLIVNH